MHQHMTHAIGREPQLFQSESLRRTNRAVFVKLQYLFRY